MEHRVVISGMGVVSPVGNNVETAWKALVAGESGVGFISRFDTSDLAVKIAAEVKNFDGKELLGRTEARHNDLVTQYALVASDEAMHDACLDVTQNIASERLGVYVGSGVGGLSTTTDNILTIDKRGPRRASPFMIPMMIANMPAGMISIRHQAKGPVLPVVTACATSAHAIGEAYRAIQHGYADAILAGGAEAGVTLVAVAGFSSARALTRNPDPQTACRPFDAERDGFVIGEGACVLVLEEREHALERGAHVYAEVVGYGNTSDAYHMTSPDPDAAGLTRSLRLAVEESGLCSDEGLYINAHGTSTKLNDASETLGIKQALGEDAARAAHISSTKSMTGHMLGATGAFEIMASALALHDGIIPPTIHYQTPDAQCDLNYTPNTAVRADVRWALSCNLGFGGHNAAVALKAHEE